MAESSDLSRSVIGASEEFIYWIEIYCDPCKKGGNLVSAEGFCVDCSEYLCGQCYNSHRRFKALENHVLQEKDSMPEPAKSTQGVVDVFVEKCNNHASKVVDFFCGTCEVFGCYACITVNHRQCEKVVHIPDIVNEPETSAEFKTFYQVLAYISKELNNHKENISSNTETNIQMKKLAKEELTKQRNKINKFFDDLEKKMDLEIEQIRKDNDAVPKAASHKLESIEKEFKEMKTSIDSKKNGQNCEVFIAMKKSKQKIETLKKQLNKLTEESRIQRYTVLPSKQIEAMMRTVTEICRMTTPRLLAKIDISTSKDKTMPRIYRLTTIHEHYCVVTDFNNKSVKVVDTRNKCVTSEIGIDAFSLLGLTTVNNDCVAVAVVGIRLGKQIRFFAVSSSGVISTTTKLFGFGLLSPCSDLDYCNDMLYLAQGKQIQTYNITRKELKTIKHNCAGYSMFWDMRGISLSPDGQTIYVTDRNKNSVTSMTLDGHVNAVYRDKDLKRPSGITVDRDGYMYVYVYNNRSGSIHQLTADFFRSGQIIIEDVSEGTITFSRCGQTIIRDVRQGAITFSSAENKLYLSDGKWVRVYSL